MITGQNLSALCTADAIFTALAEAAWTSEPPSGLITARDEIPEARKGSGTGIYIIPLLHPFCKRTQHPAQPLSTAAGRGGVFEYSQMNPLFCSPSNLYPRRLEAYPPGGKHCGFSSVRSSTPAPPLFRLGAFGLSAFPSAFCLRPVV